MKRRIILGLFVAIIVGAVGFIIFGKISGETSFIAIRETAQELVLEGATKKMLNKYIELRMKTESAVRGEMGFDDVDELAIEWEEFLTAGETYKKLLSRTGELETVFEVGALGESGAQKIVKDIVQSGYGWNYPLTDEFLKVDEMMMADAKTIGQQVKMAENDLEEFDRQMGKIEELARINVYITGEGYEGEKENLASEGILRLEGADVLMQVGKTNGNLIVGGAKEWTGVVLTADDYRAMPALSEESSVFVFASKDKAEQVLYLGPGLSGLVQVGRIIYGEISFDGNEARGEFSGERLSGLTTKTLEEKGVALVGEKMKRMKNTLRVEQMAELFRVTWIEEKMEEFYARVTGSCDDTAGAREVDSAKKNCAGRGMEREEFSR